MKERDSLREGKGVGGKECGGSSVGDDGPGDDEAEGNERGYRPRRATMGPREPTNGFQTQITATSKRGRQHNNHRELSWQIIHQAAADALPSLYQSTTRLDVSRLSSPISEHASLSFATTPPRPWSWWPPYSHPVPYPGPPILAEFPVSHPSLFPHSHSHQTHVLRITARRRTKMPSFPRYASHDQEPELPGRMTHSFKFSEAQPSCIATPRQRI